jgi:hypothetical protein
MHRPHETLLLLPLAACVSTAETGHGHVETLEAFRAAEEAGDLGAARLLMAPDARLWFEEREGAGKPWTLEGGPWKGWDDHFNGKAELIGDWHVEGDTVWGEFFETNDYFRLTESEGGHWRGTYEFDADGKLAGFLVSASPGRVRSRGQREAFEAWAFANRPEEAEYLMPSGSLDPSGDRPPRMRALLMEWRAATGRTR